MEQVTFSINHHYIQYSQLLLLQSICIKGMTTFTESVVGIYQRLHIWSCLQKFVLPVPTLLDAIVQDALAELIVMFHSTTNLTSNATVHILFILVYNTNLCIFLCHKIINVVYFPRCFWYFSDCLVLFLFTSWS